ncbi:hypothetical protein, partial [Rhodococcus erythropolis]|uniref:hypothetical protein n=1 Tax=Rhodococcus erythropolis TaxID=1833 RepID=UPI001E4D4E5B
MTTVVVVDIAATAGSLALQEGTSSAIGMTSANKIRFIFGSNQTEKQWLRGRAYAAVGGRERRGCDVLLREVRSRALAGAVEMKIHCANSASTSAGRILLSQRLRFAPLGMIDYEGTRISDGCRLSILVSIGQRITDDNGSAPEDRIATVFDVIEQIL